MSELMTAEQVGETMAPIRTTGADLLGQAERAQITNAEILAQAGDLYKIINNQIKKNEDARKALVKPLNDHVKFINAQFKESGSAFTQAKDILKTKMDIFVAEEERIQAEEARKAKEKAEAEALEAAAKHEAAGDTETAEAVVEAAADLPTTVPKTEIKRGNFGSTSSKTTWHGEVVDVNAFLQAIIDGVLPAEEFITVNQSRLDKLARDKKVEKTNFGIRLFKKVSAAVR